MSNFLGTIKNTITHWFTHHPWLKLFSLILAIVFWFYVAGELKQFNY